MAASERKTSSRGSSAKKRRQEEMEAQIQKQKQIRQEIILWILVAVSLLLFISNFGIGGVVGGFFSDILFGIFGFVAYIFPVILLAGVFFAISNKGNAFAVLKLVAGCLLMLFFCTFLALLLTDETVTTPINAYGFGVSEKNGGGVLGGTAAYLLAKAFGSVGAYIITVIGAIVSTVLLTGRLAMRGMKKKGQQVYETAREYQEERKNRQREERESFVAVSDLTVGPEQNPDPEKREEKKKEKSPADPLDLKAAVRQEEEKEKSIPIRKKRQIPVTDSMLELEPEVEFQKSKEEITETDRNTDGAAEAEEHFVEPNITGFVVKSLRSDGSEPKTISESAAEAPVGDAQRNRSDEIKPLKPKGKAETFPEQEYPAASEAVAAEKSLKPDTAPRGSAPAPTETAAAMMKKEPEPVKEVSVPRAYVFPPLDLLKKAKGKTGGNTESQLKETAAKLQQTLKTFGVNVRVTDISCGPAVTRYEIQPEMGVKVSKIVNLADDIKLNLAAADIRIEAPIPGKAAVGIEVPNKENVMVSFRELIESQEFAKSESKISFAVGRDIAGKVKVADIAKMPHVLIAGATGSGKSVCINTIIMSILYKARPDEVKLIMIDPKVVELSVYNGIPHLMIPVVTDPKKAAGALNWAVQEMTDRYNKFAETGVRKFEEYNSKIEKLDVPEGQQWPEKMCQLVIIVDELADLMMVASHEVEDAICRLAQLARAAGIHLVIATQRPSVNVITGLIKANMPSRIAFAVTSGIDSRTILDMNGAEKLLGKGDMLFDPQGVPKPLRVQGAFVSDDEVSSVVSFLKETNGAASYSSDIQQKVESLGSEDAAVAIDGVEPDDGRDSYFDEAAQIIVDKEKASIGMLQRYLKVGFNRAARIMDQLEEAGIVGPEEGTKPRKVLISADEYQRMSGVPEEL